MSAVTILRSLGIAIDAPTIRIGWEGVGNRRRLVSLEELGAWADEKLEHASEADVAPLASLSMTRDEDEASAALKQLVPVLPERGSDAADKWVCALLTERLRSLSDDEIYGPLELNDFWSEVGDDPYGPNVIQGVGNTMDPRQYYSRQNFARLRQEHEQWLERRLSELREGR